MIRMVNIKVWFWGPDDKKYDENSWNSENVIPTTIPTTNSLAEENTGKTVQIRRPYFERTWTKHCLLGTMENTLKHSNILAIKNTSFTINL